MERLAAGVSWVICILIMGAFACTGSGPEQQSSVPTKPTIKIRLTDKKLEDEGVEAVFVDIARVDVVFEDGQPPVTVVENPGVYDLFELRDGVTTVLGVAELPPGTVGQLRLVLRAASIVVDGIEHPLDVPSGAKTGIKIPLDAIVIEPGCEVDVLDVLLDFDAEQSVFKTGKGVFRLRPVVHVKEVITNCEPPEPEPDAGFDVGADAGGDAGSDAESDVGTPPTPEIVAPPLTQTGFPSFFDQVSFLFDAIDPVQVDVQPAALDPRRISVLHGRVLDDNLAPIAGVTITAHGEADVGSTQSRADGRFDLAVNGGATVTTVYRHTDFLTVHRNTNAAWNEHVELGDVIMMALDPNATTIDFTDPIEVARGSVVTDDDGTRQATLLFRQGTNATIVLADGSTVAAPQIGVRATEFTVGSDGPRAMPAELPTLSAYTYAVELSVDEAVALGSEEVRFDQPVAFYIDNFLDIPVGERVPTGYYDREIARWVPIVSGRVIEVVGVVAGVAQVDVDGSGVPADAAALAALDLTTEELETLATQYPVGTSVWRVLLDRFSPWDANWGVGCAASLASCLPPLGPPLQQEELPVDACTQEGSVIETQAQVAGETIDLAGVPFALTYRSSRQIGYPHTRRVRIPLKEPGSPAPSGLLNARLEIDNLGTQSVSVDFGPNPPDFHEVTWDGRDAYGRPLQGAIELVTRLGYTYPATYQSSDFAAMPDYPLESTVSREGITFWHLRTATLENVDDRARGLGGWSLDIHHRYNPRTGDLILGTGTTVSSTFPIVDTVVGGGVSFPTAAPAPAASIRLVSPIGLGAAPNGSLYIADETLGCVVELRDDQVRSVIGQCLRRRDPLNDPLVYDIPADQFLLSGPRSVAVAPDGDLYIADFTMRQIVKVEADTNLVELVAGIANPNPNPSTTPPPITAPVPATSVDLLPERVQVDADGTVYISIPFHDCVVSVRPDGILRPFLGTCHTFTALAQFDPLDGMLAKDIFDLGRPEDIAVDDDGSLLVALEWLDRSEVIRVRPDGAVWRVAGGNGFSGNGLDGVSALDVVIGSPRGVALDGEGGFFATETHSFARIWQVDASGIATVIAGDLGGFSGDGGAALDARFSLPTDVERGLDGTIYIADFFNTRVRKISPSPGTTGIPSPDASEIYFFDPQGRHLETVDAETLTAIWSFTYDAAGRLETVTDAHANVTQIERDPAGQPTAIVGPFGHRTLLETDADGYLSRVENPGGEVTSLTHDTGGLLEQIVNPRGFATSFTYDATGFVISHSDAVNALSSMSRTENAGGWEVDFTSPEGRTTTYGADFPALADEQTNVFPGGEVATLSRDRAGVRTTTLPDGRVVTSRPFADERFGLLGTSAGEFTITLPSGLQHQTVRTVAPTLADSDDPLSLTQIQTVTSLNGRQFSSTYDVTTRTRTDTTPQGRTSTTRLDANGRVIETQLPGRLPTASVYDALGNVVEPRRGRGRGCTATRPTIRLPR